MSYPAGRRGPNVSAYLRGLNVQDPGRDESYLDADYKKELEVFTNTTFYDLDFGQHTDIQAHAPKPPAVTAATPATRVAASESLAAASENGLLSEFSPDLEFMDDFNFGDFNHSAYTSPTIPNFPESLANIQALQPTQQQASYVAPRPLAQQHQLQQHQQHQPHQQPVHQHVFVPQPLPPRRVVTSHRPDSQVKATGPLTPVGVQSPTQGLPLEQPSPSFEDLSRHAAEEDKRKRNTAASARFRVKKKQREQALEKSAKEMADKVALLESRITSLETENEWLKTLLTEKHGSSKSSLSLSRRLMGELSAPASKKGKAKAAPAEQSTDDSNADSGRGTCSSSDEAPPPPKKSHSSKRGD